MVFSGKFREKEMVSKKRRKFEAGFKRQLLAQIAAGQITVSEAARAHDVSASVIYD